MVQHEEHSEQYEITSEQEDILKLEAALQGEWKCDDKRQCRGHGKCVVSAIGTICQCQRGWEGARCSWTEEKYVKAEVIG